MAGCSKRPAITPARPKRQDALTSMGYVEDACEARTKLGIRRVLARLGQGGCDGAFFSILNYIESLSVTLRICTPWTKEAPPRMAQATWTASVISSVLDPFSRQAWL
jgi:hypothetical protein